MAPIHLTIAPLYLDFTSSMSHKPAPQNTILRGRDPVLFLIYVVQNPPNLSTIPWPCDGWNGLQLPGMWLMHMNEEGQICWNMFGTRLVEKTCLYPRPESRNANMVADEDDKKLKQIY